VDSKDNVREFLASGRANLRLQQPVCPTTAAPACAGPVPRPNR
jgi:hypothetical protein